MSDESLMHIQELLESAMSSLKTANAMMRDLTGVADTTRERHVLRAGVTSQGAMNGRVVEGIFDGQNMMDANGQGYPVPANYASKSKLVEGDHMKLTITDEGKFIYKQIKQVERRVAKGVLIQEDGQYKVLAEGKPYRVLLASVTFYRAEVGDQITILLPEGDAQWAAIEAVLPKHMAEAAARTAIEQGATENEDGELSPMMDAPAEEPENDEPPAKKSRKKSA